MEKSRLVRKGSADTGEVLSRAANSVADQERRNQETGTETSGFDVYSHTVDGLADQMVQAEKGVRQGIQEGKPPGEIAYAIPGAGPALYAYDRGKTVVDGLTRGENAHSYESTVRSFEAQISQVVEQGSKLSSLEGLALVGGVFELATSLEQMISTPLAMIPFPALPAIRITDMDIGLPHAHAHPPNVPGPGALPSTGPVIPIPFLSGANQVLINGLPAGRCGDLGLGIWCGGYFPMYEIFLGSSNVWIEGQRAARLGVDITMHCIFTTPRPQDPPAGPPIGFTITGSPNVITGGIPLPCLLDLAMGAAFEKLFSGVSKLLKRLKKTKAFSRLKSKLKKFKKKKAPHNKVCAEPGCPVYVVTGATVDEFEDFQLDGPIPLAWRRYYDSSDCERKGTMGRGWRLEYERRLERSGSDVQYVDQNGELIDFPTFAGGSSEVAVEGFLLQRDPARPVYRVLQRAKPTMEFHFEDASEVAWLRFLRQGEDWVEFHRDDHGSLEKITTSDGRTLTVSCDTSGQIEQVASEGSGNRAVMARYQYDKSGNLVRWTDALGHSAGYEYDYAHRITRIGYRDGYSFHHEYDHEGRCIHSRGDDGLYEDSFQYLPERHCAVRTTGDGAVWTYYWDENEVITRITGPYNGTTEWRIDDKGRPVEEIDPNGNVTTLLYDEWGAHVGRMDSAGRTTPPLDVVFRPSDPNSYQLPRTPLEWEWGGLAQPGRPGPVTPRHPALRAFNPALGRKLLLRLSQEEDRSSSPEPERTERDALGRPAWQEYRGNKMERWEFDAEGNLVEHQLPDGGIQRAEYYSWSQLKKRVDGEGNETRYRHSIREEVTRVVDPGGTPSDYVYDLKDCLTEVHRHGRLKESYTYDLNDNLVAKRNAEGRVLVHYEIGERNQQVARHLSSGESQFFEYDPEGRVCRASTGDGMEIELLESAPGRRLKDLRNGLGVRHAYRGKHLMRTEVLDRFVTSYGVGEEETWTVTDPTGRTHRFFRGEGGLVSREFSNGSVELAQYDREGRCLHKSSLGRQDSDPRHRSYRYSLSGNCVEVEDSQEGLTRYGYDRAGRLVAEESNTGPRREFSYDAAGNLLEQPGLSGAAVAENRLYEANGDRLSYDLRNHLALREGSEGFTEYSYDSLDRLVHIRRNGRSWRAKYDPLARRVSKSWKDKKVEYYWDDFRLAAECSSGLQTDDHFLEGRSTLRIYVYPDEKALVPFLFVEYDGMEADPGSGRRYFIFTNQVGAPIRVEDDDGATVWSARIDPYGRVHVGPDNTIDMPLHFPGHYHDEETGLHYNRFRYYSPELGRYIQSDPMGIAGGLNLYAYPSAPLNQVDLDGLMRCGNGEPPSNKPKPEANKKGMDAEVTQEIDISDLRKKLEEDRLRKQAIDETRARQAEIEAEDLRSTQELTKPEIKTSAKQADLDSLDALEWEPSDMTRRLGSKSDKLPEIGIPEGAVEEGDYVFGIYRKQPQGLPDWTRERGGIPATDIDTKTLGPPYSEEPNVHNLSIASLNKTAAEGRQVHFDLNGVEKGEWVEGGKWEKKVTSAELRHLRDNWSNWPEPKPKFYHGGEEVGPPW